MLSLARHTSICAAVLVTAPLRDNTYTHTRTANLHSLSTTYWPMNELEVFGGMCQGRFSEEANVIDATTKEQSEYKEMLSEMTPFELLRHSQMKFQREATC